MLINDSFRSLQGLRPPLFIPELAFEQLVKEQIEKLREPAVHCVSLVNEELLNIVKLCCSHMQVRFSFLFLKYIFVVCGVLFYLLRFVDGQFLNLHG